MQVPLSSAVVTGASGFVGGHLCRRLQQAGIHVSVLARSQSTQLPGVRNLRVDVGDRGSLRAALDTAAPDVIFHLAGTTRPEELHEVNVAYAVRLLDVLADLASPPVIVLTGSAAEYGRPLDPGGVVRERDACRPLSDYGTTKLAQTRVALEAAAQGQPVIVARLFNPIGPGSPPSSAAGHFVRQVAALPPGGGTLTTGPVDAIRDFTGIEATVDALIALAQRPHAHGRIVNVCSGRGISIAEVVTELIALAPHHVEHRVDAGRHGTSTLPVVVGDNAVLQELGVTMAPLDLAGELRAMLASTEFQAP